MTIAVQAALVIVALTGLLVAAFLIPALRQIRQAAQAVEGLVKLLELELRPILLDLKATLHTLNALSGEVRGDMAKVGGALEAIQEAGESIKTISAILFPRLIVVVSFMKGVKGGLKFLFKELRKKKEVQR